MNFLVRIIGGLIVGVAVAKIFEEMTKDENFEKRKSKVEEEEILMAIDEQHSFDYDSVKSRTAKTKVTKTINKIIAEHKAFKLGCTSDLKISSKESIDAYKAIILLTESTSSTAIQELAEHYIKTYSEDKKNTNREGEDIHMNSTAEKHYLYIVVR